MGMKENNLLGLRIMNMRSDFVKCDFKQLYLSEFEFKSGRTFFWYVSNYEWGKKLFGKGGG